jgi:hypothetical protein
MTEQREKGWRQGVSPFLSQMFCGNLAIHVVSITKNWKLCCFGDILDAFESSGC